MPYKSYKKTHFTHRKSTWYCHVQKLQTNIWAMMFKPINSPYIYQKTYLSDPSMNSSCLLCLFWFAPSFCEQTFAYFTPNSNYAQAHSHSLDQCFLLYLFIYFALILKKNCFGWVEWPFHDFFAPQTFSYDTFIEPTHPQKSSTWK
jgi:hypothetical protein